MTLTRVSELFDAWVKSEEAAKAADRKLHDLLRSFVAGQGPAPSTALQHQARMARIDAAEKLDELLAVVDAAAGIKAARE